VWAVNMTSSIAAPKVIEHDEQLYLSGTAAANYDYRLKFDHDTTLINTYVHL